MSFQDHFVSFCDHITQIVRFWDNLRWNLSICDLLSRLDWVIIVRIPSQSARAQRILRIDVCFSSDWILNSKIGTIVRKSYCAGLMNVLDAFRAPNTSKTSHSVLYYCTDVFNRFCDTFQYHKIPNYPTIAKEEGESAFYPFPEPFQHHHVQWLPQSINITRK